MNEIFEKIYNDNNTDLNESSALFEKVYTEAEMLNEMNPKLRALLAAGLIGTASLGAASCSMPTDDPTIYEQPAPETTNPDNPNPDDPGDNGGGKENGGDEETVTFENLRDALFTSPDEGNDIIAKLKTVPEGDIVSVGADELINQLGMDTIFVYNIQNKSFEGKTEGTVDISGLMFMYQSSDSSLVGYVIPADMEDAFADAIAAYNNAQ